MPRRDHLPDTTIIVIAGYIAVTVAESLLAPLLPTVQQDLGLDVDGAGFALAVLAASIAIGNLIGGRLGSHWRAGTSMSIGLLGAALGCATAATSNTAAMMTGSQAVIGLGVGTFFAPGIQTIGQASPDRRGLAMAWFGVAFSAGLALAAVLATFGASAGWRLGFWVAAGMCVIAAAVVRRRGAAPTPFQSIEASPRRFRSLFVPVFVGAVGTVSQYGTVAFMAIYYVTVWDMSAAAAAALIAASRIVSVPGKLAVGAGIDRLGRRPTLQITVLVLVVTGLVWTVFDVSPVTITSAVIFAATVSGLFPIANTLALDAFVDRRSLLGLYRSLQIIIGAGGAWSIGVIASDAGLRTALVFMAVLPTVLLMVGRSRQVVSPA